MAVGYHEEVKERRQEEIRKKFDACWKEMGEEVPQVLLKNMRAFKTYFLIFKDEFNFRQGFKLVCFVFITFCRWYNTVSGICCNILLAAYLVAFW